MIHKILKLLNQIPISERKRLDGLAFIVERDMFVISNGGQFIRGQYNRSNSIVFYDALIQSEKDLKEILLHELCHHFGMDEEQVRNCLKT